MELELHKLEFHAIFLFFCFFFCFFFFKFDRPILDFLQIEFYIETQFLENQITKERHFPN